MDFLKKMAKSDLGQQMLNTARQTVEEKIKEMQSTPANSTISTTSTSKEEVAVKQTYSVGDEHSGSGATIPDEEKVNAESFRKLTEYTVNAGLPFWLFAPISVITQSKIPLVYLERILDEESLINANFLGTTFKSQTVLHRLHVFPDDYQDVLIKYIKPEMLHARDDNGQTPIHIIASKSNLRLFLALWSFGADINIKDASGKYPMDYAIQADNAELLKAFLVFDGVTSMPISIHVQNGSRLKKTHPIIQKHYEYMVAVEKEAKIQYDPLSPSHRRCQNFSPLSKTDVVALAIDGGGMKGVLALQLLKEIEKVSGASFLTRFNHIGGTSTGSIVTLGLSKYKNIDRVLRSYFRLKNDIFVGSRPYSGDGLEKALIDEFGRSNLRELAESNGVRISIPVTRVDVSPPALYMFRSYEINTATCGSTKHISPESEEGMWTAAKIVRASSAAPSFFPPVDGKYMDGGLIANNPTIDILTDCQRLSFENPEKNVNRIIVSIGTGALEKKIESVDMAKPTTLSSIFSTVNQIMHLKDVLIDQITSADGATVERARWYAEAMGMCYFRFTPNLAFPVAIDEKGDVALLEAMLAVKYDSLSMRNEMHMLASILG